jgi:hypothetical protein
MSKFLDKKEQVIDLKLTNYGHYLLSEGSFRPTYYAFLDDNVVYDSAHFGRSGEAQNDIHRRIKEETPYLESLVLFEEVGNLPSPEHKLNIFSTDITPEQRVPRIDQFRFNSLIGNSFVPEDKNFMPAWKMASLQGDITSSSERDLSNDTRVPQINITASYAKQVVDYQEYINNNFNTSDQRTIEAISSVFADDKAITLAMKDVMIYLEEVNTQVLNENFDIEVFLVEDGNTAVGEKLVRKYFQNRKEQVVDGFMVSAQSVEDDVQELTSDSVEQYFTIYRDSEIDRETACKLAGDFNKESYYIDLDFDCQIEIQEDLFFDIYGTTTEAEICQT